MNVSLKSPNEQVDTVTFAASAIGPANAIAAAAAPRPSLRQQA